MSTSSRPGSSATPSRRRRGFARTSRASVQAPQRCERSDCGREARCDVSDATVAVTVRGGAGQSVWWRLEGRDPASGPLACQLREAHWGRRRSKLPIRVPHPERDRPHRPHRVHRLFHGPAKGRAGARGRTSRAPERSSPTLQVGCRLGGARGRAVARACFIVPWCFRRFDPGHRRVGWASARRAEAARGRAAPSASRPVELELGRGSLVERRLLFPQRKHGIQHT